MRLATPILLLALSSALPAQDLRPANPKASEKARAVLTYIASLENRPDHRILSGQFTSFGKGATLQECDRAHETTGHWPAMVGFDYAEFSTGGLHGATVNRSAIDYARAGGLVTISVHLPNPANPQGGGLRDRGVDIASVLEEGTDTHKRWMALLDILAKDLAELRDAGVVVQWRPFHEMNGGWFWWGAQKPESFHRVWRHMFEYFTNEKGLDNLLWVYGPNHGEKTADYYPGDDYVDIVGLDAYTDFIDPDHIKGYDAVAKLPKPFGFTEFGPHGPQRPPGDYDYLRFLEGIQKNFPRTTFFLAWHANWSLGRNNNTKELLSNSLIVNREDLPPALAAPKD